MKKKWYESKTIWIGLITLIYGILKYVGIDIGELTPEAMSTILGIVMIILRIVTNKPVELKSK